MYLPKAFEENRTDVLHELIRERPFGALVVLTDGGLNVDHLPFLVEDTAGPLGVLRGHVARANPVWRTTLAETDAVAIFQGPQRYITPSWYATKQETGKVVPTWNYVVVHAHGFLRFVEDREWLRDHVTRLSERHEAAREKPWKVADAPEDFVSKLLDSIVGVEMTIRRLEGKWKLGQNRPERDRQGMVEGLLQENDDASTELASLMKKAEKVRDGGG
jgi:transcriptional regulator